MIEFKHFTKVYPTCKAVDDLNLVIEDGEIFGLIGHNGAGKSTTIKTLVSIQNPTSGEIMVDGMLLSEHRDEVKRRIGYVPDSPDIFLQMPVLAYWNLLAAAFNVDKVEMLNQIEYLEGLLEFKNQRNTLMNELSHGMRQKAVIIGALIAKPSIWVLDEPMTGLDPQAAFNLKQLMKEHASSGKTVLFSTHVLEVAEALCTKIAILKKGKCIYLGTVEELKSQYSGRHLEEIYLSMVAESGQEREDAPADEFHKKDPDGINEGAVENGGYYEGEK